MQQSQTRRRILRAADILLAIGIFAIFDGFNYGGSDDVSFVPWIYKWEDPGLYPDDLRFSGWPLAYYFFHLAYMFMLAAAMPIEWGLILSSILARVILLVAMRRLAEQLTGQSVPAVLFALLMTGYMNGHLAGGYYLVSGEFSTHYVAIGLVLLGVSWVIERRSRLVAVALAVATLFNPRVGLLGASLVALVWLWLLDPPKRQVAVRRTAIAGACGFIAFAALLYFRPVSAEFDEIVRVWMYIRSPWHYAPESWEALIFCNLALVGAFLVAAWRLKPEPRWRALSFAALCSMALIAGGLFNNLVLREPRLVLANSFQFGPFALALCYVFLAAFVMGRLYAQRCLSTLPVLLVPELQTRLVMMLVALAADRYFPPPPPAGARICRFDRAEVSVLAAQILVAVLARLLVPAEWHQIADGWLWTRSAFLFLTCAVAMIALASASSLSARRVIGAAALAYVLVAFGMRTVHGIRIRSGIDRDLLEACEYIERNTPKNAVFVIPPGKYEFQAYCRRSAFFTVVHLPLEIDKIPEWTLRLRMLGLVPPGTDFASLGKPLSPDYSAYNRLGKAEFLEIGKHDPFPGYLLVGRDRNLDFRLLHENNSYRLYRLAP